DHVAEPDAFRDRRERREHGERLERDLLGRVRDGREVVEDPDGLEAELLRLVGQLDRSSPGVGRIPAVVLVLPALRCQDSDLHAVTSLRPNASGPSFVFPVIVAGFPEDRVAAAVPSYARSMTTFDPTAPLAAAPDPWAEMPEPSIRSGPPWHMTDMI